MARRIPREPSAPVEVDARTHWRDHAYERRPDPNCRLCQEAAERAALYLDRKETRR